ncbi:hypothetical protein EN866_43040, partial [Mesorhizobium sp. M2D.F.Ca.ET.223.01.1.1]
RDRSQSLRADAAPARGRPGAGTGGTIPLAATIATDAIFHAHFSEDRKKTFFHSSSYTANPIGGEYLVDI